MSDQEILAVFRESQDPVMSSGEVAEQIPISKRGTRNRLDKLVEEGQLQRKQISKPYVYWIPVPEFEDLDNIDQEYRLYKTMDKANEQYRNLSSESQQNIKERLKTKEESRDMNYPIQIVD